jgi:hypothetical protein
VEKVLYIVSKSGSLNSVLFPPPSSPDQKISVVLIQEGVSLTTVPTADVSVLAEDAASRKITPVFPTISYQDMLQRIFEADRVVAL